MRRINSRKIGIYAGTFDPVHTGHIAFALQAITAGQLDRVYFLPERRPRHKHGITHYAHRVAMIRRATRPYQKLDVLELPDANFTVKRTLPRLHQQFPDAKLAMLFGVDVMEHIASWPHVQRLLQTTSLVVSTRGDHTEHDLQALCAQLGISASQLTTISSMYPAISSSLVREAVMTKSSCAGLLASVRTYASQQWLYTRVSFPA